jgi:hypothetical protein
MHPGGHMHLGVAALSSGFMTYPRDIHPEYSRVCQDIARLPNTFVLLPSLNRDVCVKGRLFPPLRDRAGAHPHGAGAQPGI